VISGTPQAAQPYSVYKVSANSPNGKASIFVPIQISAEQTPACATPPCIGGVQGSKFVPHASGSVWNFGEDIAVYYAYPGFAAPSSSLITIVGSDKSKPAFNIQYPSFVEPPQGSAGNVLQIETQLQPGISYTVSVAPMPNFSGKDFPAQSFVVQAPEAYPSPVAPSKTLSKGSQKLCALDGPDNSRPPALAAEAGIQCYRTGPSPISVEPTAGVLNWTSEDAHLSELLSYNIIPQLVIDVGGAPNWANGGGTGPAYQGPAFLTPELYSQYATDTMLHIVSTFPQITTFQCGSNEPNDPGNFYNSKWAAQYPQYNNRTGSGLAPFLMACYKAVHAIKPDAIVVGPELEIGSASSSYLTFIDNLFLNGCGYGKCWDVFSLHIYDQHNPAYAPLYNNARMDSLYSHKGDFGSLNSYLSAQLEMAKYTGIISEPFAVTESGICAQANIPGCNSEAVKANFYSSLFNFWLNEGTNIQWVTTAGIVEDNPSYYFFGSMPMFDPVPGPTPSYTPNASESVFRAFSGALKSE
jgi:hypothetical protein